MRYGILLALGLSTLVVGATCLPIFDLDPPDDSATSTTLAVSIITPAVDREVPVGTVVTVEWTAVNLTESDAIATVLVQHRDSSDPTILAGGVRPPLEPDQDTILWDTAGFDGGTYSIIAEISAGEGEDAAEATDTAEGRITINTPPDFKFTEPTEHATLKRPTDPPDDPNGALLTSDPNDPNAPLLPARVIISWEASDLDGDGQAEIRLGPLDSYDPDKLSNAAAITPDLESTSEGTSESASATTILETTIPRLGGSDSIEWDGTTVAGDRVSEGTYYLFAVVWDEFNDEQIVEAGVRITVPEPIRTELTITNIDDIWRQPPLNDPNSAEPECFWGWGDLSEYGDPNQPIVADDWVGDDDRPISEIRWWGSYRGRDEASAPDVLDSFHIGIWTGTPADPNDPNSFGHPDELVWESWANEFTEENVGCDYHSDMDSREACFRYTYRVPESEWFHQDPDENIYWISISASYISAEPEYRWGWQTRARDPNTAGAVRISGVDQNGAPTLGAQYDQGELITSLDSDVPWDLAFRLKVTETDGDIEFLTTGYALTLEFTLDEDNDVFVDLRIDPDENHSNGNETTILGRELIEKGTTDGSFDWDGRDSNGDQVGYDGSGIFQLFMVVDRGPGPTETIEAEGLVFLRERDEQPLITLLEPDADVILEGGVGGEVLIKWRCDDPSESAKIRLVIDDDATPAQATEPSHGLAEEEVLPSADWGDLDPGVVGLQNTYRYYVGDDRAPRRYWIFAYIDRDEEEPWDCIAIAAGQIVVEDPNEPN